MWNRECQCSESTLLSRLESVLVFALFSRSLSKGPLPKIKNYWSKSLQVAYSWELNYWKRTSLKLYAKVSKQEPTLISIWILLEYLVLFTEVVSLVSIEGVSFHLQFVSQYELKFCQFLKLEIYDKILLLRARQDFFMPWLGWMQCVQLHQQISRRTDFAPIDFEKGRLWYPWFSWFSFKCHFIVIYF